MRNVIVFLICCCVIVTGCQFSADDNFDFVGTELGRTKVDDLSRAIDFAANERQFDVREFQGNVQTALNRWVSNSDELVERLQWQADPSMQSVTDGFDSVAVLSATEGLAFIDTDAIYLQELAWLARIIDRLPKSRLSSLEIYRLAADDFKSDVENEFAFAPMFARLNPELDSQGAAGLAKAHLLFDWVVRNVQLLPEVNHSEAQYDDLRLNDRKHPAAAGIAGTGYQRFPQQSLLNGRGDYVDRAKIFMIGLRILGLDSVLLAAADSAAGQPKPWAVAVAIGGQYYLFDTRLGLAVPGKTVGSTATLADLRGDSELLERLDLTVEESLEENTKYWLKPEQLKSLVGLIYAPPESLSKRFALLQNNLTDTQQLPYLVSPADLQHRLPASEGVEFAIWDIAVKTHAFRQAVREALEDTTNNVLRDRLRWYFQEEGYIAEFPRYRTGRVRFFYGLFENEREFLQFNAIDSLQNMLYTDEDVEGLATDVMLQERLGILSADRNSVDFKNRLASVQEHMRLVRRDSGVFMAQCHFDNSSFGATDNWVKILRSRKDVDRWADIIQYLSARAAESQKDYDAAIAELRKNPTRVQAHGNIIRARLLESAVRKVFES